MYLRLYILYVTQNHVKSKQKQDEKKKKMHDSVEKKQITVSTKIHNMLIYRKLLNKVGLRLLHTVSYTNTQVQSQAHAQVKIQNRKESLSPQKTSFPPYFSLLSHYLK